MSTRTRIIFQVGSPDFHPSREQSGVLMDWLGSDFVYHTADSLAAFEHLNECDLLVLLGMNWTGWENRYRSPSESHRRNFEKYVSSGRPILSANGAPASYDDWPRFGEFVGFTIHSPATAHTAVEPHAIRIIPTRHPIIEDVGDYTIVDELYYDLTMSEGMDIQVHAQTQWQQRRLPIVITAEGGRIDGAGKTVYLANGHDMRAFESPQFRQLWLNAVKWCLEG